MLYRVNVFAKGEDGDLIFMGASSINAANKQSAQSLARDEHWDNRLDCTGCRCRFKTAPIKNYYVFKDAPCFLSDGTEVRTRFVFDGAAMRVTLMQVRNEDGSWVAAKAVELASLSSSLQKDDVFSALKNRGAKGSDSLPEWAR